MTAAEERLRLYGERNNLLSTDVEFAATMIRAAIAEEREACIQIVEAKRKVLRGAAAELGTCDLAATVSAQALTVDDIAAAIRARGDA